MSVTTDTNTARLAQRARIALWRLSQFVEAVAGPANQSGLQRLVDRLRSDAGTLRDSLDDSPAALWDVPFRTASRNRKGVKPHTRQWLWRKWQGRCAYCRRPVEGDLSPTFDHVVPRSRGGGNTRHNLAVACQHCNQAKGDRTPEEWAADILAATGKAVTP